MTRLIDVLGSRYGWRGALVLPAEYFSPSAPAVGRLKVWTGTQWVSKPVKVWTGSAWQESLVLVYAGGQWT